MITHAQLWAAIDMLALQNNLSPSGLARRAGLDGTTFNPSKRRNDTKERWPSTQSLALILDATDTTLGEFATIIQRQKVVLG